MRSLALIALLFLSMRASAAEWSIYEGTYTCAQGLTSFTLMINPEYTKAKFKFETRRGVVGEFKMSAKYDQSTQKMKLKGEDWIKRPDRFSTVDLAGTFYNGMTNFDGDVTGAPSCTTFQLINKKSPDASTLKNTDIAVNSDADFLQLHTKPSQLYTDMYLYLDDYFVANSNKFKNNSTAQDTIRSFNQLMSDWFNVQSRTGDVFVDKRETDENLKKMVQIENYAKAKMRADGLKTIQDSVGYFKAHLYFTGYDFDRKVAQFRICKSRATSSAQHDFNCDRSSTFVTEQSQDVFLSLLKEAGEKYGLPMDKTRKKMSVPFYVGFYSHALEIPLSEGKAEQLKNNSILSNSIVYRDTYNGSGNFVTVKNASAVIADIVLQPEKSTDFIWTNYTFSFNYSAMKMIPKSYCLSHVETKAQLMCGNF